MISRADFVESWLKEIAPDGIEDLKLQDENLEDLYMLAKDSKSKEERLDALLATTEARIIEYEYEKKTPK